MSESIVLFTTRSGHSRAHAKELQGKRLALLVSCHGTPAAVQQKGGQEERSRVLEDFISELIRK